MAVENVTRIPALVQKISRGECVDGEKWFVLQIILEWCNIAPQGHEGCVLPLSLLSPALLS